MYSRYEVELEHYSKIINIEALTRLETVSYTHLDVYKRQDHMFALKGEFVGE